MKKRYPNTISIKKNTIVDGPLNIILLCAGEPYGMKTFDAKPLFTINGKYLLEIQIDTLLRNFPLCEITVVLGYNFNKVVKNINKNFRIVENNNFDTTNEAEQLRLALNSITSNNVLIINGDIYIDDEIKNIDFRYTNYIYSTHLHEDCCGITVVDNKPTILSLDIEHKKFAEIMFIKNLHLEVLKNICSQKDKKRLYLFEVANLLLNKTNNIIAQELNNVKKIVCCKDIS